MLRQQLLRLLSARPPAAAAHPLAALASSCQAPAADAAAQAGLLHRCFRALSDAASPSPSLAGPCAGQQPARVVTRIASLRCFSADAAPAGFEAPAAVLPVEGELSTPKQYRRVGRVEKGYKVAPEPVFAVVEVGATQFKVVPNDVIVSERLRGVDVNDIISLDRVLLLGSRDATVVGRPLVPGARVEAAVEEQFLDGKVLVFKKRRRKNSRRLRGHRQPLTTLRILRVLSPHDVVGDAPAAT